MATAAAAAAPAAPQVVPMEYRELGNTGLKVSVLALGCFSFAGDKPTGTHLGAGFTAVHAECWGEQDEADSFAAVKAALDAGINIFDNAEMYGDGHAEEVLGRALEGLKDEYPRESYIIATKLSETFLAPELIEARLRASLKRLRTDYIDLYQLHWASRAGLRTERYPDRPLEAEVPLAATLRKLQELQAQGLIRHIGVCNFGPKDMAAAAASGVPLASNQVCYNLIWRGIEREVLPLCARGLPVAAAAADADANAAKGEGATAAEGEEAAAAAAPSTTTLQRVGVLAWSPLQQGILSGKFKTADDVPPGRQRTRLFSNQRQFQRHGEPGHEELLFQTLQAIREIAASIRIPAGDAAPAATSDAGAATDAATGAATDAASAAREVGMVELALAWCLAQPGVTCALMGARNADQVRRNMPALLTSRWLRGTPEGAAVLQKLDAATSALKEALGTNLDPYESAETTRIH